MPELSIIIINWNSKALLVKCLGSLSLHEMRLDYEVLVIDNNSADDFADIHADFPERHRFIKFPENIGFGRACNAAAGMANAGILLFLGPDTEILHDDDLCRLLEEYSLNPRLGALGCQFVDEGGERQYSSVPFPSPANILKSWWRENSRNALAIWCRLSGRRSKPLPPRLEYCDAVLGHCLMVARDKFEAVGGFPPDVFLFSEDIELCKKLVLAGYTNAKDNRRTILHRQHKSIREKYGWDFIYLVQESLVRFNVKYHGRLYSAVAAVLTIFAALWNCLFLWIFSGRGNARETFVRNGKILQYYLYERFRIKNAGQS